MVVQTTRCVVGYLEQTTDMATWEDFERRTQGNTIKVVAKTDTVVTMSWTRTSEGHKLTGSKNEQERSTNCKIPTPEKWKYGLMF